MSESNLSADTNTNSDWTKIPKNIFILGGNSPMGVAIIKKLLDIGPMNVIATYRSAKSAQSLLELAALDSRLRLIELDLRRHTFCDLPAKVSAIVEKDGLNVIINLAGIFTEKQTLCDIEKTEFMKFMEVNTISPLIVIKELLPLLIEGSEAVPEEYPLGLGRGMVVSITSSYGSISENSEGKFYMSRSCRAAMNAAMKSLSLDLLVKRILVVTLHPGVQKSLECQVSLESCAEAMVASLISLDESHTGRCFDFTGKEIPW